jgi:DNA-binding IclR family transcriptional regulator
MEIMAKQHTDDDLEEGDEQGGVLSIETGMRLLMALADTPRPQILKSLAAASKMPAPKAHRYLVSFIRTGLVERDPGTGGYRFGPAALRIGISALSSLNIVRLAGPELGRLRDELGITIALAVWGTHGPTYVLVEEGSKAVTVNAKPGSVLPLTASATGRIFATFLSETKSADFIERELAGLTSGARKRFEQLKKEVRRYGLARSLSEYAPSIDGLSAPIFDHQDQLVAAITIIGSSGEYDPSFDGGPATALLNATHRLSRSLGQIAPPNPSHPKGESPRKTRKAK